MVVDMLLLYEKCMKIASLAGIEPPECYHRTGSGAAQPAVATTAATVCVFSMQQQLQLCVCQMGSNIMLHHACCRSTALAVDARPLLNNSLSMSSNTPIG